MDVKILKPVYNKHLNIADTFFGSQWYLRYWGSILVPLVYTTLFNKHFQMPNPYSFLLFSWNFKLFAWLNIEKVQYSCKFANNRNLYQTRSVTCSPWILSKFSYLCQFNKLICITIQFVMHNLKTRN